MIDIGSAYVSTIAQPVEVKQQEFNASIFSFANLHDAESFASFALLVPSVLPTGMEFVDAKGLREPHEMTALNYFDRAAGTSLLVVQSAMKPLSSSEKPTIVAVGQGLSETKVGTEVAALVQLSSSSGPSSPGRWALLWEQNRCLMQLFADGMERSTLIQLAASMVAK